MAAIRCRCAACGSRAGSSTASACRSRPGAGSAAQDFAAGVRTGRAHRPRTVARPVRIRSRRDRPADSRLKRSPGRDSPRRSGSSACSRPASTSAATAARPSTCWCRMRRRSAPTWCACAREFRRPQRSAGSPKPRGARRRRRFRTTGPASSSSRRTTRWLGSLRPVLLGVTVAVEPGARHRLRERRGADAAALDAAAEGGRGPSGARLGMAAHRADAADRNRADLHRRARRGHRDHGRCCSQRSRRSSKRSSAGRRRARPASRSTRPSWSSSAASACWSRLRCRWRPLTSWGRGLTNALQQDGTCRERGTVDAAPPQRADRLRDRRLAGAARRLRTDGPQRREHDGTRTSGSTPTG